MKTSISLITCLGLALASPAAIAASKFYKWTDAQGVTHYSEDPPPESARNTTQVKVPSRLPSDSEPAATPAREGEKKEAAAGKPAGKKDDKATDKNSGTESAPERYAEKCKKLQSDLKTMQEHARVKVTDEKGESRVLDDDEKNAQMDDLQRQMKAYCQ